MRIAIVYFANQLRERVLDISKGLARGIENQGHHVDIIDGEKDVNTKLTIYEYIIVGAEPLGFIRGKISNRTREFLSSSGVVMGKRCFAFTVKRWCSANRALSKLMKHMESEGMYLTYSNVLNDSEEAQRVGKQLHIKKD